MCPCFRAGTRAMRGDGTRTIFALPDLCGGNEYGEAWHKAAMFQNKQNVFDDFFAAAEYLIANGYTTRERFAIRGRFNGALLMGAAMTQRPDLFATMVWLSSSRYATVPEFRDRATLDDRIRKRGECKRLRVPVALLAVSKRKANMRYPQLCSSPATATLVWIRCTRGRWRPKCRLRTSAIALFCFIIQ